MSLLVVGSVALDSVETPFGKRDDVLGGSATYFAAAASLLTKVSVVGVVGEDFPLAELEFLRRRGVELDGLEKVRGRTFRWRGRYGFDLNAAETLDTQLNVFEHFSPKLGPVARKAERIFLGNIDPELQIRVLDQAERPRLVCADTMNYWISSRRPQLQAAHAAQRLGVKAVVVKRGEYGALLVTGEHSFFAPAFPLADVRDPTGAGDTFAGGFLGLLDRMDAGNMAALRQATVMGCTIASFTVEQFSLDRLRELDLAQVRARFNAFRQLVHFDELPEHVG